MPFPVEKIRLDDLKNSYPEVYEANKRKFEKKVKDKDKEKIKDTLTQGGDVIYIFHVDRFYEVTYD